MTSRFGRNAKLLAHSAILFVLKILAWLFRVLIFNLSGGFYFSLFVVVAK